MGLQQQQQTRPEPEMSAALAFSLRVVDELSTGGQAHEHRQRAHMAAQLWELICEQGDRAAGLLAHEWCLQLLDQEASAFAAWVPMVADVDQAIAWASKHVLATHITSSGE